MFVKICGLTTRDAVQAAARSGADALGFVFARSVRRLTPEQAAELCRGLPEEIVRVAVMRHPTPAEWTAVRDAFDPDWLQTDAGDFAQLELHAGCAMLPVYRNGGSPPRRGGRVLFEGALSGSGMTADWHEAARIAATTELILAGGLDCDNVAEAIQAVAPWGVDVSSGVEQAPGVKDPEKIAVFIARARAAEGAR